MKKRLKFNLADREKYLGALKLLHGGSDATEKTHTFADADSERVSRMQGILGIRPERPHTQRQPHKERK